MTGFDAEAVLITGLFGTGKSSVAVEIADTLEANDRRPREVADEIIELLGWDARDV